MSSTFTIYAICGNKYDHCTNFISRHWTYKMPVRWNLSSVWVRLSIFSQLSIIQYVGLCVYSVPISFVMIERIYMLCLIIIIKSEVWSITRCLTHWGRVTHICVSKLTIIDSDYGSSPGRRLAIIRTNARILLIGPLGTNLSEILIEIHTLSGKWRPFCLGPNVLRLGHETVVYAVCLSTFLSIILASLYVGVGINNVAQLSCVDVNLLLILRRTS